MTVCYADSVFMCRCAVVVVHINMKGLFDTVGSILFFTLAENTLHLRLIEFNEKIDRIMIQRLPPAWCSSAERHEVMHWTISILDTVAAGILWK